VPGSGLVKRQAEKEGLDRIIKDAGFEWREPGCSMCLGMNEDQLSPHERCASTSNRNFEGRQGARSRTHLVSPAMAAAAAITGRLSDVRQLGMQRRAAHTSAIPARPRTMMSQQRHASSSTTGMPPFTVLRGIAAPLPRLNIDTDIIIPKQFLKTIKRSGLGIHAFDPIRYLPDGSEDPEFVLNKDPYRKAKILIAGNNFGCGSSREHAPWAINDFGIRCLISTAFADIFFGNCFKNGMLPIVLPQPDVDTLMADASAGGELEVDLPKQVIRRPCGGEISFEVNDFRKHCLVNGFDDISLTLQNADAISAYEKLRAERCPWLSAVTSKA